MNKEEVWYQFHTVLEYVTVLSNLSKGIRLNINQDISKITSPFPKSFEQKQRLIDLTYQNLIFENKQILDDANFAFLCCSWIAPKGYYLLFTQQCLLFYLLTMKDKHINFDHWKLRKCFDEKLLNKSIEFDIDVFNQVRLYKSAIEYITKSGSIFSKNTSEKLGLILKKNVIYAEEDFKRKKNILNYRTKSNKEKKEEFLLKRKTSLYHFFYHMRIKSNYRDLEFMKYSEISNQLDDFISFYNNYYSLIMNFYEAYDSAINKLIKIRLG
jgi:hypothetical protein